MRMSCGIALACCLLHLCVAGSVRAEEPKPPGPGENVRILLIIQKGNTQAVAVSVVSAGGDVEYTNTAGSTDIDGQQFPMVFGFNAHLTTLKDQDYLVKINVVMSKPMVVSTVGATEGARRSNVQYQDVGVETQVRLRLGQELVLSKDPEKTLTLRLEAAD